MLLNITYAQSFGGTNKKNNGAGEDAEKTECSLIQCYWEV